MKMSRFLILTALVLVAAPTMFAADFGVRAGRYDDIEDDFVGAEMVFDLGRINVNPNIEYVLNDDVTAGSANIDLTFNIAEFGRVSPYLGAGVGLWYVDADGGDNTSDLLGNVIGGVSFNLDFLKPYAQVKYFRLIDSDDEDSDIAFTVGLRF